MQASLFPIIHRTHIVCWSMVLVITIQAGPLNSSKILESIVQQAVNSSLPGPNSTDGYDLTSSLTNRLLSIMHNRGVELRRKCKPQSNENLRHQFLETNLKNKCVTLTSVNVSRNKEVFAVTTMSDCITSQRMSPECFPDRSEAHCSTRINITDLSHLGDDFFPKFVVSVSCGGCRGKDIRNSRECQQAKCGYTEHFRSYKLLKRVPNRCDVHGSEVWEGDKELQKVNVACSCLLQLAAVYG